MDWDAMIADLESSFDAERRADLVAQSVELAEAEHASIELVDRLRGSVGRLIHLRTRGGVPVDGVACRVEPSYVLVADRHLLVGRSVHKLAKLAVVVKILHLFFFQIWLIAFVSRVEGLFKHFTVDKRFDFCTNKSCTFARFNVLIFYDFIRNTVDLDL